MRNTFLIIHSGLPWLTERHFFQHLLLFTSGALDDCFWTWYVSHFINLAISGRKAILNSTSAPKGLLRCSVCTPPAVFCKEGHPFYLFLPNLVATVGSCRLPLETVSSPICPSPWRRRTFSPGLIRSIRKGRDFWGLWCNSLNSLPQWSTNEFCLRKKITSRVRLIPLAKREEPRGWTITVKHTP